MQQRLQKIIAEAGVCSRRQAEELIADGKVMVNGHVVTELGTKADPEFDRIMVNNKPIETVPKVYFIMYKPRGVITSASDELGRQTVFDILPAHIKYRLVSAGRLDFDSEGALLLTNDGDLANRLIHPSRHVVKEYEVKVKGVLDEAQIKRLEDGVMLDGSITKSIKIVPITKTEKNAWYTFYLREGRNRQIRRMLEAIGCLCLKIKRVRFAGISIEGMEPGEIRELDKKEIRELKEKAGLGISRLEKSRKKPAKATVKNSEKY